MSVMVMTGKAMPSGAPVAASGVAGPLVPMQLPSTLAQMTWKRSVSIGLPGPSIASHQPGSGLPAFAAACASGDRPLRTRIALSPAALGAPQVS